MDHDVIIALDFENREKTLAFLDLFQEEKPYVKIGMELFYAEGPSIVREIKARGHRIFLDLKLHDIPNTVKKAMHVLSTLDVDMTNLHAAGTIAMMEAAKEGLTRPDGSCATLLAVTQLTSTSEERMQKELLINASMPETVKQYARNAKAAGLRRRGVLAPGGSPGEGSLRPRFPHRDSRHPLCGWGRGGPGAGDDPCPRPGRRQRLHRGGPSHYRGGGPRGGLSPLREGIPGPVSPKGA